MDYKSARLGFPTDSCSGFSYRLLPLSGYVYHLFFLDFIFTEKVLKKFQDHKQLNI